MRAALFILSSISAITTMAASTALPTMAFPTEAPEETLLATTPEELPPVIDPIPVPETPSQNSFGVVPDDIKNTMQGIRSLASDLILQAYNINGDGVKVQIVGVRACLPFTAVSLDPD